MKAIIPIFVILWVSTSVAMTSDSLHTAVIAGDKAKLNFILSDYHDINERNQNGETPLHTAVCMNQVGFIPILLNRGADIEARTEQGFTPLHYAIQYNNLQITRMLLLCQADYNAVVKNEKHTDQRSVLHIAAFNNTIECLELLLKMPLLNLEARDELNRTALHVAAISNQDRALALLLCHGARLSAAMANGSTVLHIAVSHVRHQEILKKLLPYLKKKHLNIRDERKNTPLHKIAYTENVLGMSQILFLPGNINAKNSRGNTPLHLLLLKREEVNYALLNFFLQYFPDITIPNDRGQTPLSLAHEKGLNLALYANLLENNNKESAAQCY